MGVVVTSKRVQARRIPRPSVLGDGLPERLRSMLFLLLGVTAAAGLATVGMMLRQDFPFVFSGPIVGSQVQDGDAPERVGSNRDAAPRSLETPAAEPPPPPSEPDGDRAHPVVAEPLPPEPSAVLVTGSTPAGGGTDRERQPRPPPSPSPAPPARSPAVAVPPPGPSPTPAGVTPEPIPDPVPAAAPESTPGKGHAYGKGQGNGLGVGGTPPGHESQELE